MDERYEKIINCPHYRSRTRPQMPNRQRAAQFAPFAALTGYEAVLAETARQTEVQICLTEEKIAQINRRLNRLKENLAARPSVEITFFRPDGRKEGGSFRIIHGKVLKIDEFYEKIRLESGEDIDFSNIIDILIQ